MAAFPMHALPPPFSHPPPHSNFSRAYRSFLPNPEYHPGDVPSGGYGNPWALPRDPGWYGLNSEQQPPQAPPPPPVIKSYLETKPITATPMTLNEDKGEDELGVAKEVDKLDVSYHQFREVFQNLGLSDYLPQSEGNSSIPDSNNAAPVNSDNGSPLLNTTDATTVQQLLAPIMHMYRAEDVLRGYKLVAHGNTAPVGMGDVGALQAAAKFCAARDKGKQVFNLDTLDTAKCRKFHERERFCVSTGKDLYHCPHGWERYKLRNIPKGATILYHGTNVNNISSIVQIGLKKPGQIKADGSAVENLHGHVGCKKDNVCIYTSKSIWYAAVLSQSVDLNASRLAALGNLAGMQLPTLPEEKVTIVLEVAATGKFDSQLNTLEDGLYPRRRAIGMGLRFDENIPEAELECLHYDTSCLTITALLIYRHNNPITLPTYMPDVKDVVEDDSPLGYLLTAHAQYVKRGLRAGKPAIVSCSFPEKVHVNAPFLISWETTPNVETVWLLLKTPRKPKNQHDSKKPMLLSTNDNGEDEEVLAYPSLSRPYPNYPGANDPAEFNHSPMQISRNLRGGPHQILRMGGITAVLDSDTISPGIYTLECSVYGGEVRKRQQIQVVAPESRSASRSTSPIHSPTPPPTSPRQQSPSSSTTTQQLQSTLDNLASSSRSVKTEENIRHSHSSQSINQQLDLAQNFSNNNINPNPSVYDDDGNAQWYYQNDHSLGKSYNTQALIFPTDYAPYNLLHNQTLEQAFRAGHNAVDIGIWTVLFRTTVDIHATPRTIIPASDHVQVRKGTVANLEKFRAVVRVSGSQIPLQHQQRTAATHPLLFNANAFNINDNNNRLSPQKPGSMHLFGHNLDNGYINSVLGGPSMGQQQPQQQHSPQRPYPHIGIDTNIGVLALSGGGQPAGVIRYGTPPPPSSNVSTPPTPPIEETPPIPPFPSVLDTQPQPQPPPQQPQLPPQFLQHPTAPAALPTLDGRRRSQGHTANSNGRGVDLVPNTIPAITKLGVGRETPQESTNQYFVPISAAATTQQSPSTAVPTPLAGDCNLPLAQPLSDQQMNALQHLHAAQNINPISPQLGFQQPQQQAVGITGNGEYGSPPRAPSPGYEHFMQLPPSWMANNSDGVEAGMFDINSGHAPAVAVGGWSSVRQQPQQHQYQQPAVPTGPQPHSATRNQNAYNLSPLRTHPQQQMAAAFNHGYPLHPSQQHNQNAHHPGYPDFLSMYANNA